MSRDEATILEWERRWLDPDDDEEEEDEEEKWNRADDEAEEMWIRRHYGK